MFNIFILKTFDMLELIRSIPGSTFLLLFALYSFLVIFLSKKLARLDGTHREPIPEPTQFLPEELAYLKKGIKGSIITITMSLAKKKLLSIKNEGKKVQVKTQRKEFTNDRLRTKILNFFSTERTYADIFSQ